MPRIAPLGEYWTGAYMGVNRRPPKGIGGYVFIRQRWYLNRSSHAPFFGVLFLEMRNS